MKLAILDSFYKGWAVYQIAVHSLLNNTTLIADGGSENNNSDVDGFLGQPPFTTLV